MTDFSLFLVNFQTYLKTIFPNPNEDALRFIVQFEKFVTDFAYFNEIFPGDISLKFSHVLSHQSSEFQIQYRYLYQTYAKQHSTNEICTMDIQSEDAAIVYMEDVGYPIVEYRPIQIDSSKVKPQYKSHIRVCFDSLNLLCSLQRFIMEQKETLELMDVERKNKELHQFDSEHEIKQVFEKTRDNIQSTVPIGAKIYMFVKKIGDDKLWKTFLRLFHETFQSTTHQFKLKESIVHSRRTDPECDDRLVIKFAISLMENKNNDVYVVSNDMYRSMENHWHLPTRYITHSVRGTSELIELPMFRIGQMHKLKYVGFDFTTKCNSHLQGMDKLVMELKPPIVA